MQPNNPSQLPPPQPLGSSETPISSMDYLNQISAPAIQKTISPVLLWAAIGGFLLFLAGVVFFALSSGGPSYSERLTNLVYRIDAVKKLVDENSKNIQSTELRRANSSLSLALTNTKRDSTAPLAAAGVKKITAPPKTSPILKEFADVSTRLEDARLNNVFDAGYARELSYQLATIRSEIKSLSKSSKSKSLKEFLTTAENNFAPLSDQFSSFNNAQA